MFFFGNKVNVTIEWPDNSSSIRQVKKSTSINELLQDIDHKGKQDIIAANINNTYCDLHEKINQHSIIRLISLKNKTGLQIYRNTAIFILGFAAAKIFGKNILDVGPSIQFNYYFDIETNKKVTGKMLKRIKKEFDSLVKANLLIERISLPRDKAVKYFRKAGELLKTSLIKSSQNKTIKLYKIGKYKNICDNPVGINTGIIQKYRFVLYSPGFLIEFPRVVNNELKILKLARPNKLSKIFLETRDWYKTQGVSCVSQLNDIIRKKELSELINISEALHEKRISIIADKITKRRKELKFILIAGPSSSGKTTFAKRLSIQLKVNGLKPVSISLDNYFVDRESTPRDENGNYDFDCLEALDLELFNRHLTALLKEKDIEIPVFDFRKKKRIDKTIPFKSLQDQIILIEGIHGLNEKLTYAIPGNRKFKVYVSAVSQLRLANDYRIATRDARLIRRIVRDYNFRSNSAYETLKMWNNVRKGEERLIFPFQEDADIIFNSALIYETCVLKPLAGKCLKMVSSKVPEYAEVQRLLDILGFFCPASFKDVPKVSILREFIGGSAFEY